MATQITWLGHNCWSIETAGQTVLLDPFLDQSPTAPVKAADVRADFILVSHGHFDHVADAAPIAKRTGATVLAGFEVGRWLVKQGVAEEKVVGMNPGGGIQQPFGRVEFTVAQHSSSTPDGGYGGVPGGFVLRLADGRVYFACDTALFLDMKLIGAGGLDLAVLPIGDLYTMGPDDAIDAVNLLQPKRVVPCHYNTWPNIQQNPVAWADRVRSHTAAEPVVLAPGEQISL
jgi:L-ascorbate metabolism protein UlaG (beta-lactamase superfamily)